MRLKFINYANWRESYSQIKKINVRGKFFFRLKYKKKMLRTAVRIESKLNDLEIF